MEPPFDLAMTVTPSEQKATVTWDWEYHTLSSSSEHEPQEPTGFILERKVGSGDFERVTYQIDGDEREYEDILPADVAAAVFVDQESLSYRIKAYWISNS